MAQSNQAYKPLLPDGPLPPPNISSQSLGHANDLISQPGADLYDNSTSKRKRKDKVPQKTNREWESIKEPFTRLYLDENLELDESMRLLREETGFIAS